MDRLSLKDLILQKHARVPAANWKKNQIHHNHTSLLIHTAPGTYGTHQVPPNTVTHTAPQPAPHDPGLLSLRNTELPVINKEFRLCMDHSSLSQTQDRRQRSQPAGSSSTLGKNPVPRDRLRTSLGLDHYLHKGTQKRNK